jgi:hypothetical protein
MPNYNVTINLSKLDKSAFFEGKNGKYCKITLWENDREDQFGNTHSAKQDLGKDRKGEKSEYVGNAKPFGGGFGQKSRASQSRPNQEPPARYEEDDSDSQIPF